MSCQERVLSGKWSPHSVAEAYQTPRRKQEAASQALVISQPPSSHSGSSVNSGYLGPCIGRIPGCLFTDVSHKSCQVMQRWKTKKRRHCTVLFSPPRPRPSSPLKIRPPKQMPGLLSSERSEHPARLQQSRLVSGWGVEGEVMLNRGSLSGLGVASSHNLDFTHCLLAV